MGTNKKYKILLIARTCPFPPNDGEKIRIYNLLKNLSHHHITLVCRAMNEKEQNSISELEKYCSKVICVHIPSPSNFIEKIKWILPFVFSRYPLSLSTVFFKKISEKLQELCESQDFDIIQVEHSSLSIYLDHLRFMNKPKKIVTMHNIDYVRNARIINNLPWSINKIYNMINQWRFEKWELSSLQRFDRVIVMSEVDKEILTQDLLSLNVEIVCNGVDTEEIQFSPQRKQLNGLIFVASMDSDANHDAALFFIKEIFPLIKQYNSTATIHIVGRRPRQELLVLNNSSDIVITGMVDNVLDYYNNAAISVIPLRSGGGTRLKILEAMAARVPVVSTTVGAEGLHVEHKKNILIADTPEDFAGCVQMLWNNKTLRDNLIKQARRDVELEYDWKHISEHHEAVYQDLCNQ